ncbi:xyloglucan galactosyltransferase KATAMARI1 homolog [Lotus japonicus]|uniref:xyloglucan galactosyltransferase KATAMARI1 homolog n=1 Tax=Lotus japonicus TaxID=34305 RepID=UPI00258A5E1A|nr:xyloglucan galactosyltransferase KATAMARI1 homolog [Lotus japonicus]
MEKSTSGKSRNKFWFFFLATSFGWLLCYAYFTVLKADNTLFIFLGHSFATTSKIHGASHSHMPHKHIHVREQLDYARNPIRNMKITEQKKKHVTKYGHQNAKIHPNHKVKHVDRYPIKERHFSKHKIGSKSVVGNKHNNGASVGKDPCSGRYIFIHELPSRFNRDMVKNCHSLSPWTNMCNFTANLGLGPVLSDSGSAFLSKGWYATHQFMLELIFHNRMRNYKCLTKESSKASAIFVPYYAGLDVSRYLWLSNASMRDAGSIELVKWLREKPEWRRMWGRDHFMVAGRITWDFRRPKRGDSDHGWGNQLLNLPETRNMTVLVIEKSPWNNNDFAIPYPTYFHPAKAEQVFDWQNRMRKNQRTFLFCFAGAPRPGKQGSIRGNIFEQCRVSGKKCKMLECEVREESKCHQPGYVMGVFQTCDFCLQPSGDSYTRRSIFDSMLAGCVPVFFHPGSAYVQYLWHFPKDYAKYSVFISENDVKDGKVSIERVLSRISKGKVESMRGEVIKMIPGILYADPRFRLNGIEDAFDVTIKRVLERVNRVRREMRHGVDSSLNVAEELTWKYSLSKTIGEHKWDSFFVRKEG